MRVLVLVLLCVVGWSSSADAEKARAKNTAKVYNRAGERGKIVVKLKSGQVMRILRKEGRWYKVRVKGRTGWIPRSKVELLEEEMVRNTRRRPFVDGRSTKRGFGSGAPDDRVGEDATVDRGGGDDEEDDGGDEGGGDDEEDDGGDDKPTPKPKKPKKPKVTKKPKPAADDAIIDDDDEESDFEGDEPADDGGDEEGDDDEESSNQVRAHVKKKVAVFYDPDEDSEEAFTAKPDMVLFPTGKKKGDWIEVETDEGDIGYVRESSLEMDDEGGGDSGPRGKAKIDLRGRLGFTIIQQGMRTAGGNPTERPDNYNLSTSAATVALGGTYLRPYSKAYVIGGELAIGIAKAIPGIKVDAMNTTGITVYDINARAMFGKDFKNKRGMVAYGRLGFRYYSYQVSNATDLTKNTARLPSEIIKAPTIGAAFAIPKLTDKIGLDFSLDAMVIGASMQQTKNLEDGDKADAKGICAGIGLTYRWKPKMDIYGTYGLAYTTYAFGAPLATSMRGHTGTDVNRTDVFHAITVGVNYGF